MKPRKIICTSFVFLTWLGGSGLSLSAQNLPTGSAAPAAKDSTGPQQVLIRAAFKPHLPGIDKISFDPLPVRNNTKPLVLGMDMPQGPQPNGSAQTLPGAVSLPAPILAPLPAHSIRLGLGNLNSLKAQLNLMWGENTSSHDRIVAHWTRMTGKSFAQEWSQQFLQFERVRPWAQQGSTVVKAFYQGDNRYRYGFAPDTLSLNKTDLRLSYSTLGLEWSGSPWADTGNGKKLGLTAGLYQFGTWGKGGETQIKASLPYAQTLHQMGVWRLSLQADLSFFQQWGPEKTNALWSVATAWEKNHSHGKWSLGFAPSWDQDRFYFLPQISASYKLPTLPELVLEAGYWARVDKNGFRSLVAQNPWLGRVDALHNTRTDEQFVRVQWQVQTAVQAQLKLARQAVQYLPLWVNQGSDGKAFGLVWEQRVQVWEASASAHWQVLPSWGGELGAVLRRFNTQAADKAWGQIPLSVQLSSTWQPLPSLLFTLKADAWDGAPYKLESTGFQGKSAPALDLNFRASTQVNQRWQAWVDMNNLLNQSYQRWNQYPVFGFQVMAGVVYSFR